MEYFCFNMQKCPKFIGMKVKKNTFHIYRRSSDLYVQKGRMILWSAGKWTFIQLRSFCRQRWLLYGSQKRARQLRNKIASEKMLLKNKTKYIVTFLTYIQIIKENERLSHIARKL